MKKVILVSMLVLLVGAMLSADTYVRTKNHTDPVSFMGQNQPAKDEVSEQWFATGKMATVTPERSLVVDKMAGRFLMIDKADKSYIEAPLPLDMSKLLPAGAASMMAMMKVTAKVVPTAETKVIGKWKCTRYNVTLTMAMGQMNMVIWASSEVGFDWQKAMDMAEVMSKMQMLDEASIAEFKKVKGFTIASEMTMSMMGANIKVTSMVEEIAQKPAPKGVFDVPAGFTKKDTLSMEDLQKK